VLLESVLILTTICVSRQGHAQAVSSAVKRATPMITLRIYNHGVSHALLVRSEGEATAILNHAGLQVGWVDCPLSAEESASYPACRNTMGSAEFTIKILTAADAQRIAMHRDDLGEALECLGDYSGCSAYVFYRDVRELARGEDVSDSQLLGHALAHEIGHLLLGARSHSANGIMRAHWHQEELYTIARAHLFFTEEQSERMRAEVSRLNSNQQNQTPSAGTEDPQEAVNSIDGQRNDHSLRRLGGLRSRKLNKQNREPNRRK
jgi:hypothetical protein